MIGHTKIVIIFVFMFLLGLPATSYASQVEESDRPVPPTRYELETLPKINKTGEQKGLPIDIRKEALKEAALSYGARGGLAWRTYHIRQELDERGGYMDQIFDFRQLLVSAPSGLLIEPPVVSESVNSMIIEAGGQTAAVADRIYNIIANARIVPTARSWRNYLEREWGEVKPPPDILRPENEEERENWIVWIREGWDKGVEQADEIFQTDLQELVSDYQGMVRYRVLLTQGIVSPPAAMQVDRGITGGGSKVRVGDRAVQIRSRPELIAESETWQPASR